MMMVEVESSALTRVSPQPLSLANSLYCCGGSYALCRLPLPFSLGDLNWFSLPNTNRCEGADG
jgi:hypothetical protein